MIEIFEYQLPFVKPFRTAVGEITDRRGGLLRYSDSDCEIITEAAPLPGFSSDRTDQVLQDLILYRDELDNFFSSSFDSSGLQAILKMLPASPALQFAVSFLGIQLLVQKQGASIEDIFLTSINRSVAVNEILTTGTAEEIKPDYDKARRAGFSTFKFKAAEPLDSLTTLLHQLHNDPGYPAARFRLDANRSLPPDQLQQILEPFDGIPIEYIEEPSGWKTASELESIIQRCPFPIALDESAHSVFRLNQLLHEYPGIFFIIKPTIMGNLFELFETIRRFRSRFNHVVVTTSLESRIGRSMTATVAALIGDPGRAHGLHTGRFFEQDLLADFDISNGRVAIPPSGFWNHKLTEINRSFIQKVE